MPTNISVQEWVQLPSGSYVSDDRMQKDGDTFTLYNAANMDIEAFNKTAKKYDVQIEEQDDPITRLVKYSVFQSRKHKDGSFIPLNEEYVDMILDVAAAKARGEEPLASFYKTLINGPWDAVREILQFQEKIKTGKDKGKYIAIPLVFNEDAVLEQSDDNIIVANEGWTRILGARHKYPIETSEDECIVENIEIPSLEGNDVKGFWYVGKEPEKGEQSIVLRGSRWLGDWLLYASVFEGRSCSDESMAALRLRNEMPKKDKN